MKRATLITLSLFFTAVLASACGGGSAPPSADVPTGTYKVDALFWDFYTARGGEEVFGPAITSIFTYQGQKMQYLENGLMVYAPQAGGNGFSFAALGLELNLVQQPSPVENAEGGLYVGEYFVPAAFLQAYQRFGADIIGAPLTNPIPNYTYNRLEQHFTNLGLYYLLDDPNKEVRLLEYGLAVCGSSCRMEPDLQSAVADVPIISAHFVVEMQRLGAEVTGSAITAPFTAQDGREEVIFENQVFYAENNLVSRRALPELVGYAPSGAVGAIQDSRLFFVPTSGGLGHNVLAAFHDWILQHNGYETTGMPTTEVFPVNHQTGVIRQCFTYMCLDYYTNAAEQAVRPAALGQEYRLRYYGSIQPGANPGAGSASPGQPRSNPQPSLALQIWDQHPLIQSTQPQTISTVVLRDDAPVGGVTPSLHFSVDGGPTQTIQFPATNESGLAEITLAPIAAKNSSLVTYQVCVAAPAGGEVCAEDSFLIWGNP